MTKEQSIQGFQHFIEDSSLEWETVGDGIQRKIMGYNEDLMLAKVKFEKGAIGTLHHHIHSQVSFVAEGEFEVEIDGEKKLLKAGDTFFVNPNLVHGAVCLTGGMLLDMFSPMRKDFIK